MKKLIALLIAGLALGLTLNADAATKKKEVVKKTHPAYKHTKADKKKVPAKDTSPMPHPDGGPAKK
jgi:hypothetical protein